MVKGSTKVDNWKRFRKSVKKTAIGGSSWTMGAEHLECIEKKGRNSNKRKQVNSYTFWIYIVICVLIYKCYYLKRYSYYLKFF